MKIPEIILAALFVLFAYFQFNDPDSALWVILYFAVAGFSAAAAFGYFNKWIGWGLIAICAIGGLLTVPSLFEFITNEDGMALTDGMSYEYSYIEESREFGGLLISLFALLFIQKRNV